MNLSLLLRLQVIYMISGAMYNCVSIIMKLLAGQGLSSTSPASGLIVMAVYGLFLIPGFRRKLVLYRIFMGIAFIGLGYGGVITHILNYGKSDLYYSSAAWITAIIINVFGLVLNAIALSGKYRR